VPAKSNHPKILLRLAGHFHRIKHPVFAPRLGWPLLVTPLSTGKKQRVRIHMESGPAACKHPAAYNLSMPH
jgi:hypothetical protein